MIELLSKYVEMDKEALELELANDGDQVALMLSIPVIRARDEEEIKATLAEEDAKKEDDSVEDETEDEAEETEEVEETEGIEEENSDDSDDDSEETSQEEEKEEIE